DPGVAEYQAGLASANNSAGIFYQTVGDSARARAAYEEARALYARLVETCHDEPSYRLSLAFSHSNLGTLLRLKADTRTEAEAAYLNAFEFCKNRAPGDSADVRWQDQQALSYMNLGALYADMKRYEPAEEMLKKALAIRELLARQRPAMTSYQDLLAGTYY